VRFDVDRNWRLVRSLVENPEAAIQYIFVARWLEALLVEHALAQGVDLETVWRAQVVLRQPSDSAAHDDHFHVRIGCPPEEAVAGCEGGGPHRPWVPRPDPPPLDDDQILAALFDGGDEPKP
jgi:penicillin-insensitive murein endopeptidase